MPSLYFDLLQKFKLPMLPGSKNCAMNSVNINARPFMGPNLYMRPPGSFTNFHQDRYGTVDSSHL